MSKRYITARLLLLFLGMPGMVNAQTGDGETYKGFIDWLVNSYLQIIISIVLTLLIIAFFWRGAQFILHADSKTVKQDAKQYFLWGILAIFVASTIYGILSFLLSETGLGDTPVIPQLDTGL